MKTRRFSKSKLVGFCLFFALIAFLLYWIVRLVILLASDSHQWVPSQADEVTIILQYWGEEEIEVVSGMNVSAHPDLSGAVYVDHAAFNGNGYSFHVSLPELGEDLYIIQPQVYEILNFSTPVEIAPAEGAQAALPDGREWFTIQSVEYDGNAPGTVRITLSPLLDGIPPTVTLAVGGNRIEGTPQSNPDAGESGEWSAYCFDVPLDLLTTDGRLPQEARLVMSQARVLAEREELSFTCDKHTVHVVQ